MFFRKKNYEAIEKKIKELVTNQQKAINNMKCPVCGGTHFTSGYKGTDGFSVTKSSLFKDKDCIFPTTFAICETCGHIEIFTMFHRIPYGDFKRQNVEKESN